jgi:hypothetical protein
MMGSSMASQGSHIDTHGAADWQAIVHAREPCTYVAILYLLPMHGIARIRARPYVCQHEGLDSALYCCRLRSAST